jgi:hypothetical protein
MRTKLLGYLLIQIKLYAGVQRSCTGQENYSIGRENNSPVVQIGCGTARFFFVVDLSGAEEADGQNDTKHSRQKFLFFLP